jgi:hypothetical protein
MRNKIIVLKMDGRKMEFEDSYWGWQHLQDYVSREVKQRTPQKIRTMKFPSLEKKHKMVEVEP